MCVPAECPATGSACLTNLCQDNQCVVTNVAQGEPCSENNGVVCDGNGTCTAEHCMDGIQDADETDVDCGGSCGATCRASPPEKCSQDKDCVTDVCDAISKVCLAATCSDGHKNGVETDVDCGGAECFAEGKTCAPEMQCVVDSDCTGNMMPTCNGAVFTPEAVCDATSKRCQAGTPTTCQSACTPLKGCVACTSNDHCPGAACGGGVFTPANTCTSDNTCAPHPAQNCSASGLVCGVDVGCVECVTREDCVARNDAGPLMCQNNQCR